MLTWHLIFPESTRSLYRQGDVLPSYDRSGQLVHYIDEGVVIDTRADESSAHHIVNIGGKGALLGFLPNNPPLTEDVPVYTAANSVTARSAYLSQLLSHITSNPSDGAEVMKEVARRTIVAHRLLHAAAPQGTSEHLLAILAVLADCAAIPGDEHAQFLPVAMLERVCGCPWTLIRQAINDLSRTGKIELSGNGIRLRQAV